MSRKNGREREADENVSDEYRQIITSPNFFDFVLNVMNADNKVDVEAMTAEFDEDEQQSKEVAGKTLTYVGGKALRKRLQETAGGRYSFIILAEQRVTNPLPRYDKDEEEYIDDTPCYLKVTAMLAIQGVGVQIQYGVKKTFGFGESDDWKAASTDAFKKCCQAFGIEATYSEEENDSSEGGGKRSSSDDINEALEDVEFDQDEYEEALEHEIKWGKYKNMTFEEIYDEDDNYLEWIALNAREKDECDMALMVLKGKQEESGKKKKKKKSSSKSSEKSSTHKSKGSSSKTKKKSSSEDEKQELIDTINEAFADTDSYDKVTQRSLIKSVSTNSKHPSGKKKLEDLTVVELKNLVEAILDDDDEDEEDDEE